MAQASGRPKPQRLGRKVIYEVRRHAGPFVMGLFVALFTVYGLDRRPPLILSEARVPSGTVEPGQVVVVDWLQEWKRLCPGTVTRELTTSHGEVKKFRPFNIEPPKEVGAKSQPSSIYIPNSTHDGPATMQSTISFRCNFLNDFWPLIVKAPPVTIQVASKG